MKQRKKEQGPDCPLTMAAEDQSELSIPPPTGKKENEVESPPHSVAGRTVSLSEGFGGGYAIRVRRAYEDRNLSRGKLGT